LWRAVQNHTNHKLNRELQNFMYSMMDEKNGIAAKKSLQVDVPHCVNAVWLPPRRFAFA
jgi:hypothetical protein